MDKFEAVSERLGALFKSYDGEHDRDHMVVEFTTTYAISAYHH
jgi:hypothetical protein